MSPVRRIAVGLAVAAVAVLATAVPASAHDSLVHSTPEADQRLATPPESITLTYSGDLLVLGDSTEGAVVLVVDATGHDWATGEVDVDGRTVTALLDPGMPAAGYQVRWQVVSEDGHPISGVVPFTVGDAEPMAASASAGTDSSSDETVAPSEGGSNADPGDTDADAAEQTPTPTDDGPRVLIVGIAGSAIAAVALLLFRFLRRPRTAPAASADADAAEND